MTDIAGDLAGIVADFLTELAGIVAGVWDVGVGRRESAVMEKLNMRTISFRLGAAGWNGPAEL